MLGTSRRNLTFAEVATDEGLTGVSEAMLNNRTDALLAYLDGAKRRHVIGCDPFNIEDIHQRMFRNDFGRAGEIAVQESASSKSRAGPATKGGLGRPHSPAADSSS